LCYETAHPVVFILYTRFIDGVMLCKIGKRIGHGGAMVEMMMMMMMITSMILMMERKKADFSVGELLYRR
jgi:hypothetical protein